MMIFLPTQLSKQEKWSIFDFWTSNLFLKIFIPRFIFIRPFYSLLCITGISQKLKLIELSWINFFAINIQFFENVEND